jgi:hypothetical protein
LAPLQEKRKKAAAEAQLKGLSPAGLPQHRGGVLPGKLKTKVNGHP